MAHDPNCCHTHDAPAASRPSPRTPAAEPGLQTDEARWSKLRIEAMDCPTEERLLRDNLQDWPGVESLEFNLLQRTLNIRHRLASIDALQARIRELGMDSQCLDDAQAATVSARPARWWPLGIAGLAALASEILEWSGSAPEWAIAGLAIAAILIAGLPTYRKGWIALRNLDLNINALMSIAVTGALLIGQWPEAAMVCVLFALAERIEAQSLSRARDAIGQLLQLAPETATVQGSDGQWQDVAANSVTVGSLLRVKPGERIALDGEVHEGHSSVNQAPITGESLPVDKQPGDPVFAGTLNTTGSFTYRSTRAADNSTLSRIIHAVEQAQGSRAPMQRFVDRFARIYTPVVFLIAILTALLPPLLAEASWSTWFYNALVLLVIACPCALVISTPVTLVSGLARAARLGILVKGGVFLERGRQLGWLALDKTGTLTTGKPVQTDFVDLDSGLPEAQLLSLAKSLAAASDHPVSQAVAKANLSAAARPVEAFEALLGRGVRGRIDGQDYWLGNHRLVEELGVCSSALEQRLQGLERQGRTVIVLCRQDAALALFAVADTLKPHSAEAIAQLKALGVGALMLSGDNRHTAEAIAAQAGIEEARGELLPEDKQALIAEYQQQGRHIGMVGDGINDAPALALADIGFAMGAAGTDTAIETADVALMDDDLRKIPLFIRLSRRTHRILIQNISLALGIKAVFLILTFSGQGSLWMAVFADMGASLLVVFNGLRLLKLRLD